VLTPCVGRDDVLDHLGRLLSTSRWVTVTGAPGSGKSLVAKHVAAPRPAVTWVTGYRHTRDTLVTACLDALAAEVAPGDSPDKALKRALDGSGTLLVLDDVDAIDGLGDLLHDLVEDAAAWTLLCTASSVAGQAHEHVLRLPPLPVPEPGAPLDGPALELLLARVAAAGGPAVDLALHEQTLRRLLSASGGLPALIEQLAVQVALVGVRDVGPANSFGQVLSSSYDLLDEEQRRCLRRLSAIGRPVSLDALSEACGTSRAATIQHASALARRSLVDVLPDGRFVLLPPMRAFGRERAEGQDVEETWAGLRAWAQRVLPQDYNSGAADATWIAEVDLLADVVEQACASSDTRAEGYHLANRAFSSLYTAMRPRDALRLLETALDSGDGPGLVGSQAARRAGICASEVRGTYEGLRLLGRADEHAATLAEEERDVELARTAAIRAEMHLDAGDLARARVDVERTLALGDPYVIRQVRRTLMDLSVSCGDLATAESLVDDLVDGATGNELWIALSARTLQAKVALEQGRLVEARSLALFAREQARQHHEDRIALLADVVHRAVSGEPGLDVDRDSLPWAVRLVVLLQDARDLMRQGDVDRAAGRAADAVVLADSAKLGRDGVEARLIVADALMLLGDPAQAQMSYLSALRRAAIVPMPLRAADALDGLAAVLRADADPTTAGARRQLAGAAAALRASRAAVAHDRPGLVPVVGQPRDCPAGWLVGGQLTPSGVQGVAGLFAHEAPPATSPLDALTRSERKVAELVSEGLTSRQIAEALFVSPRTVDAHLSHIYRKLGIPTRAKLAALMAEVA
jgi:DNA-binding CsgD family transcriptional regulator